jgi:hypothetical protein
MYMYMYVCMYVCILVCIDKHIRSYVHTCVCILAYIYTHTCMYIHVDHIQKCGQLPIYIHPYTHTHTHTHKIKTYATHTCARTIPNTCLHSNFYIHTHTHRRMRNITYNFKWVSLLQNVPYTGKEYSLILALCSHGKRLH